MAIKEQIISVLKSAEIVFELAIIDPMRYGPIIHANIPDYAEILMKIFLENNGIKTDKKNFYELIQEILKNPSGIDYDRFQTISNFFLIIREQFRNPLHHTDKVQGYIIAKPVALECLFSFNELLTILFQIKNPFEFSNINYPCYIDYLRMEYDQALGKVSPRFFKAVVSALQRLEEENAYHCPSDFDSARLIAIRHLYHMDSNTFVRYVFNYRPQIKGMIISELQQSSRAYSSNQLLQRLKLLPDNRDLTIGEIERCLLFIEGEEFNGYGKVIRSLGKTSSGNTINRYSLVA